MNSPSPSFPESSARFPLLPRDHYYVALLLPVGRQANARKQREGMQIPAFNLRPRAVWQPVHHRRRSSYRGAIAWHSFLGSAHKERKGFRYLRITAAAAQSQSQRLRSLAFQPNRKPTWLTLACGAVALQVVKRPPMKFHRSKGRADRYHFSADRAIAISSTAPAVSNIGEKMHPEKKRSERWMDDEETREPRTEDMLI